jgi:hypothetical protein
MAMIRRKMKISGDYKYQKEEEKENCVFINTF